MPTARLYAALALPLALAAVGAAAGPAAASGGSGGGGVRAAGPCSAASDWKLKAKADNGRLEVELQVDSNKVGQRWSWQLSDNGAHVARGMSTTTAPSGSFSVARRIPNTAGKDVISFTARQAATGESCRGAVTVG